MRASRSAAVWPAGWVFKRVVVAMNIVLRLALAAMLPRRGVVRECRMRRGVEQSRDMGGNGKGRREARRFDAIEVHQARHAMCIRPLHQEVGRGLTGAADLGPDAGIARLQAAIPKPRPIAADGGVEA